MTDATAKFLADARRYLDLAEGRAAEGKMAGAIRAAWRAEECAHDLAQMMEHDRAAADRLKRAAGGAKA